VVSREGPGDAPRRATAAGRIAEIVLRVNDLEKMVTFYRDVVGLPVAHRAPDIVFLKVADLDTPLGRGGHPQLLGLVDRHRPLDEPHSTLDHLAFEIDRADLDDERERLGRLGLTVDVETFGWAHARALFFNDPEGNRVEFIAHDGSAG